MIKVGLIGTGFIGSAHAEAYRNMNNAKLVSIADVNEVVGRKLADEHGANFYKDAENMLKNEDIDIVDICLPTFLHESFVLLAAKYNKHIICEKPFTLSEESAAKMIKAAESANVKFMVAQVIRFWPEYVKIKKLFDTDKIGEEKMIYASRLAQHPDWTTWHKDPKKSGGGLFDLHIHDIDFMCYLFGDVESVYAIGWQSDTGCWNHVMTSIKFKNGKFATVEGAFDMTDNFPFTMKFRAAGTNGSVDYNFIAGFNLEDVGGAIRNTVYYTNGQEPEVIGFAEIDAYQSELEYFVSCVQNDKPVDICPPSSSLDVVKVTLAIKKSLETGELVKL